MQKTNRIACCAIFLAVLLGLSVSIATAQDSQSNSTATSVTPSVSAQAPTDAAISPKVRIGPGDLLDVTFFDVPELTQDLRVNDVGDVTFSLIGRLHLAGLNVEEAQSLIAQKYSSGNFLVNPQVSVLIKEYATQGISVLGEVMHPGVYQALGKRTVFDMLSLAGGVTQFAGNKVSVQRASDGSTQIVSLSERKTTSLSSDLTLEPGDKIVVPRAGIIFVIGDVNRPGGYVMNNDGHLSLLQAVSMAMGTKSTASLNKTRLIRKSDTGYTDTTIALKKVLHGNEPDEQLQADDIVYVPNSAAKSILYRGAPSVVDAAGSAAIYSAY